MTTSSLAFAQPQRALGIARRYAAATPKALVYALAAFLVVNFARTHEMFSVLFPFQLGKVTGVPLVVLALSQMPRGRLRAALRTGPGRGMMFIGLMMILSIPLSIWPGHSLAYVRSVGIISYIMFISAAGVLVDRTAALWILQVELAAVTAGALRMLLPGARVYMEGDVPRYLFGYTYDPNDTAVLMLVSVPLALYFAGRRGRLHLLWYPAAAVMTVAMVRTGSRGGLLGLVAMISALVLLAPRQRRVRLLVGAAALGAVFSGVVASTPTLRARFASTFEPDYNQTATNGRLEIWKRGLHYVITHPVTGVGIDNFTVAELRIGSELKAQHGIVDRHMFTAHNSVVQISAELGVPGFLAYIFVFGSSLVGLWKVRRLASAHSAPPGALDDSLLASAVMTSLSGLFVAGFFLSLAYSPMTVFTFAVSAAVIASSGRMGTRDAPNAAGVVPVPRRMPGRRGGLVRASAPIGSGAGR